MRGVKPIGVLLVGLTFVFIGTIFSSQPAKAEGFLLPTVKCLVGKLLWVECPGKTQNPTTPTPPPSTEKPPAQSPTPSPAPDNVSAPSSAQNTALAGNSSQQYVGGPRLEDATVEPIDFSPVKEDTKKPFETSQRSIYQKQLANINLHSHYRATANSGQVELLTPSQEGWKMAGIAWYWWVGFVGVIVGSVILMRNRYLKNKKNRA